MEEKTDYDKRHYCIYQSHALDVPAEGGAHRLDALVTVDPSTQQAVLAYGHARLAIAQELRIPFFPVRVVTGRVVSPSRPISVLDLWQAVETGHAEKSVASRSSQWVTLRLEGSTVVSWTTEKWTGPPSRAPLQKGHWLTNYEIQDLGRVIGLGLRFGNVIASDELETLLSRASDGVGGACVNTASRRA